MPERPELYKFNLFNQPMHLEEFWGTSLIFLTYVVLDPETAGLRRSQGDDIISLAGVRIRDGEVRRDDGFDGQINPGRAIPKGSIKFHGITDDMLSGAPTVPDVLRRIRDYVGDAVLVAHNAAFDMKFLKLKETDAGVAFDHVVLDSLLLSVFPHNDTARDTLDTTAERFDGETEGRHTARGDSLVTAGVFFAMLGMLASSSACTKRSRLRTTCSPCAKCSNSCEAAQLTGIASEQYGASV